MGNTGLIQKRGRVKLKAISTAFENIPALQVKILSPLGNSPYLVKPFSPLPLTVASHLGHGPSHSQNVHLN